MSQPRLPSGIAAVLHTLAAIALFSVSALVGELAWYLPVPYLAEAVYVVLRVAALALLLHLYGRYVAGLPLSGCRTGKPNILAPWMAVAVLLPVGVSAVYLLWVPGHLAVADMAAYPLGERLAMGLAGPCLSAGICEELLFRGFILRVLERRWNRAVAAVAPSVVFGALHIGNMQSPTLRDILLLLAAGTAVGVMFSLIALQADSIWPAAVVHGVWNLLIIGPLLEISQTPSGNAIVTYTLRAGGNWLTGGAFGIESALPALAGYLLVSALALALLRRRPAHN